MKNTSCSTAYKNKAFAYSGLIFVIFVWGASPLITLYFYNYFSPTIRITFSALVSGVLLFILSINKLKLLNKRYFLVAVPTGFFLATANILQKIGLKYTTPTHYSFLENLSCVAVPFLLLLFIKKKPAFLTVFASLLCLLSAFILSGMGSGSENASVGGDILCGLAGIFYGVNIAATGAFAKKLCASLYLMLQTFTEMIISLAAALVFDSTGIETIKFTLSPELIILNIITVLVSSTLCWLIRTSSLKYVDASVVAVMMPFSSVITTVFSVFAGKDSLTARLVIGAVLCLVAVILSGLADRPVKTKKK